MTIRPIQDTDDPAAFGNEHIPLSSPALLLDLDGTLLELAPRPDDVVVPAHLPALLQGLSRALQGAIAIISGRPIQSIDLLLQPFRSAAAGLHGTEVRTTTSAQIENTVVATSPHAVIRRVPALIDAAKPVLLEDKGACLAIHHHFTVDELHAVKTLLHAVIAEHAPDLDLLEGRRVLEIKPRAVDKGIACRKLLATPAFAGRTPIYFGDDITDIAAFRFMDSIGGWSVAVGPRVENQARRRMSGPSDVLAWLAALHDALAPSRRG